MKYINILISLLVTVWISFVFYRTYDFGRIDKLAEMKFNPFPVIFPLLILFCFVFLILFVAHFLKINLKKIKIGIWHLAVLIFLGSIVIIISKSLLLGVILFSDIPLVFIAVATKLFLTYTMIVVISYVWYLFGNNVIKLMKIKLVPLTQTIASLLLGLIFFTIILLILSLIGKFQAWWILGTLLFMFISAKPQKSDLSFLNQKIELNNFHFEEIIVMAILLIQIILNCANLLTPIPTGYDSLSYYFKLAKELADSGKYVYGQYAMPVEMLFGSQMAISKLLNLSEIAETMAIGWSLWAGLVGIVCIYALGRTMFKRKVALLAAAIFYTMPLIGYFQSLESKPEIFVPPLISLTILLIYQQWRKLDFKISFLIFFYLLFAFNVKITSIIAIIPFFFSLILVKLFTQQFKQVIWIILSFILAFIILILPWFFLHLLEQPSGFSFAFHQALRGNYYSTLLLGKNPNQQQWNQNYLSVINKDWIATGYSEDYSRYESKEKGWFGLAKYLSIPWYVTVSDQVKVANFMISPLYIALLPLVLLLVLYKKQKIIIKSQNIFLVLFTLLFLILWLIQGRGIVWYGIGLLVLLSVYTAAIWEQFHSNLFKPFKTFWQVLILSSFIVGILLQAQRLKSESILGFATGKLNRKQAIVKLTNNYINIADIINADPDIQSGNKKLIISGSYLHYFINNYYNVAINDLWVDNLAAIVDSGNGDYNLAKENFKKLNIKYIIFNLGSHALDESAEAGFMKKYDLFMDFADKNLLIRQFYKEKGVVLLEVV